MKQIPKTPSIINCYCGDKAEVFECDDISIGYYNTREVMCDRNQTSTVALCIGRYAYGIIGLRLRLQLTSQYDTRATHGSDREGFGIFFLEYFL